MKAMFDYSKMAASDKMARVIIINKCNFQRIISAIILQLTDIQFYLLRFF